MTASGTNIFKSFKQYAGRNVEKKKVIKSLNEMNAMWEESRLVNEDLAFT